MNPTPAPPCIYNPEAFADGAGYAGIAAVVFGPELDLSIPGIVSGGRQMIHVMGKWCAMHGFPKPDILLDRDAPPAGNDLAGTPDRPQGKLLYPDGAPRYQVLCVPGGNDQAFAHHLSSPRAAENVRSFVLNGGAYSGVCAGMCLATLGYSDPEGKPDNHAAAFANFFKLWPYDTDNLHGTRYLDFAFNPALPKDHFLRKGFPDVLRNGRYNDGVSMKKTSPAGQDTHTEYILEHLNDPTEESHTLDGTWATIAWIPPGSPRAGRLVLNGWHPESSSTPDHHHWLFRCVDYARKRTVTMPPLVQQHVKKGDKVERLAARELIGDNQLHFYQVEATSEALEVTMEKGKQDCHVYAAKGRYPSPTAYDATTRLAPTKPEHPWVIAIHGVHAEPAGRPYAFFIS